MPFVCLLSVSRALIAAAIVRSVPYCHRYSPTMLLRLYGFCGFWEKLFWIKVFVICGTFLEESGGVAYSGRHRREEPTAGKPCQEAIECGQGSYCDNNKLCSCLSTHVRVNGFCWPKINPGQTGCTHDRQCSAAWPGAVCQNGECKCANGQPPVATRDGPVCLTYGYCPINGEVAKYKDDSGNPITCNNGTDSECPAAYDCICGRPGCPENAITFCCPSRSLACIMPMDQGTFGGGAGMTLSRWYHNPLSGDCESFTYRGQGGNANNFESKEHCESYCKQTCNRGLPQYEEEKPPVKQKQHYCSNSQSCQTGLECTPVGTVQFCCPKISFICSKNGGLVYSAEKLPKNGYDSGTSGGSSITYARFYFEESEKKCMGFSYKGQGGNFNNFASMAECEQFCAKMLCEAGEPLKDPSGMRNLQCSGSECPATHYCNSGVCCPTKQSVCKLPKAVGFCSSTVKRWWFNAASGTCEEFMYSGCHGNANNFAGYKECVDFCRDVRAEPKCSHGRALKDSYGNFVTCGAGSDPGASKGCPVSYQCNYDGKTYGCCPTQTYTCTLPYEPGTQCGPSVSRWYYDHTKRTCLTFDYLGCDGNSNNFATQQDCKEYCHVESCPEGGELYTDETGSQRSCRADGDCPNTHYCTEINKWSGTSWSILNYCCPNRNHICTQYMDSGAQCSGTPLVRFWFNRLTKTCEEFTYNGCGGNRNNFVSRKSCMTYCMAAACPTGTIVHQSPETEQLTMCNLYGEPACPAGFTCHVAPLMQQNICCGSPPGLQDVCPTGSYPYLDPLALSPIQCTPNVDSACPPGYFCSYRPGESSSASYYCCRSRNGRIIGAHPQNITRGIDTGPEEPHETGAGGGGGTGTGAGGGSGTPRVCPPDLAPIEIGSQYKYCSPTALQADSVNSCSVGHSCQWAESLQRYICCGPQGEVPMGQPSPEVGFEPPIVTTTSSPSICPPVPPGLAPQPASSADGDSSDYRLCSPLTSSGDCLRGGSCLYSDALNRYVCCGLETESIPGEPAVPTGGVSSSHSMRAPSPEQTSADCGETPGYAPVQPYKPCSPSDSDSCGSKPAFQCFHSSPRSQYVCCFRSDAVM